MARRLRRWARRWGRRSVLLGIGLVSAGCRAPHDGPVAVATPPVTAAAVNMVRDMDRESWYGAYLQDHKIGYMEEAIRPIERGGQHFLQYSSNDQVDLDVQGQPLSQGTSTLILCDLEGRPKELSFSLTGGQRRMAVAARFMVDKVECDQTGPEGVKHVTVPIPAGETLAADERLELARRPLQVGQSTVLWCFNPIALNIEKHTLTEDRLERLTVGGEAVDTTVIAMVSPWATITAWVDAAGRARQCQVLMMSTRLSFREEPKDEALKVDKSDGHRADLIVAAQIKPDKPIAHPREVRAARYRVKGLSALSSVPADAGQRVKDLGDGWTEIDVTAPPPGGQTPPTEAQRATYLRATTYIESDNKDIIAAAKEALGYDPGEEPTRHAGGDAAQDREKCHRLQVWVQKRIKWQWNVGLFRSALEVLHDPAGVCRDAAALYTALARAAGMPTRVCGGLLYTTESFLGHAWAETWVHDRWLPVDATMTQPIADAARIKLSEGADYTALFDMLPALGNLKIEVIETGGA